MAVTAANVVITERSRSRFLPGGLKAVHATVTFTGSYATGGETTSTSTWEDILGLRRIQAVIGHVGEGGPPPTTFSPVFWNPVTNKLQVGTSNGAAPALLAEKTAAAWGTAPTGQLLFIGY